MAPMLCWKLMDPFVQKLIRRLQDPSGPLSRNRHFHTFETPEGKLALKVARRLKSLQRDILACAREGKRARVVHHFSGKGFHRIELVLERLRGSRTSILAEGELELLRELPGVQEVLELAPEWKHSNDAPGTSP
jgi:hypothetical protein